MTNQHPTVVSFGEMLMRLTPPLGNRLSDTPSFDVCYGGSEANVMIALSSMGDQTSFLTLLPDNDLGTAAKRHLCKYRVNTDHIIQKGSVMGSYFFEPGFDALASKVIYHRRYSEVARPEGFESQFDWDEIFASCGLFHISGISFALSADCRKLCFTLLKEAKKRKIPISFDFNYRGKLWSIDEAKAVYQQIVPYVDILFCSKKDLEVFLDLKKADFYKQYNCKYLVVRERKVLKDDRHSAVAKIYHFENGQLTQGKTEKFTYHVLDRIGSGDAFCAGVLHQILKGTTDLNAILDFGMSAFILKHYIHGDILVCSEKEINDFNMAENKDVKR